LASAGLLIYSSIDQLGRGEDIHIESIATLDSPSATWSKGVYKSAHVDKLQILLRLLPMGQYCPKWQPGVRGL